MIRPIHGPSSLWILVSLSVWAGGAVAAPPVGSVAMYSDGRVEKLLSIEDQKLLWEDDRKRRFLRSANPILPVLERTDFLSGKGYRQIVVEGEPVSIGRQAIGERVGFKMNRIRNSGKVSSRIWECSYLGRTKNKVLGTIRDLDSYTCERFIYQRKTWQRQFRESRVFSYSPELDLVVDMQRKTRKKSSAWKLVAIIPPDKATYKRLSRKTRKLRSVK